MAQLTQTGAERLTREERRQFDCIVVFRPHFGFKGEYGFDWVRIGDYHIEVPGGSGIMGYIGHELIGRYLKEGSETGRNVHGLQYGACACSVCSMSSQCNIRCSGTTPCFDCPSGTSCILCKGINWQSERFKYDNPEDFADRPNRGGQTRALLNSFTYFAPPRSDRELITNSNYIQSFEREMYSYIPKMTIFPEEEHKLKCKMYIPNRELSENLIWEYDDDVFELTDHNGGSISTIDMWQEFDFKIKCRQSFSENRFIDVYFVDEDGDRRLCGRLEILANNVIKPIDIILIEVKTGVDTTGRFSAEDISALRDVLKQAYITFGEAKIRLDPTQTEPGWFAGYLDSAGTKVADDTGLIDDLNTRMRGKGPDISVEGYPGEIYDDNRIRNACKIYVLDEECSFHAALANKSQKACLLYSNRILSTLPHEILHILGLSHTFMNNEADPGYQTDFVYSARQTDNIMDYGSNNGYKRKFLFYGQWKLINNRIN